MTDTRAARLVRWTSGVIAVLVVVVICTIVAVTDDPTRIVLVGVLDSFQLAIVLTLIGCVDVAVLAFSIRAAHPLALVGVILARVAATGAVVVTGGVAMLATLETSHVSAVIDDDGCDTGYVVRETDSYGPERGVVYHMDGLVATMHGSTQTGPAATPFHDGAYTASVVDHVLRVAYAPTAGGAIDGGSTIQLIPFEDWRGACGHARPAYTPELAAPSPTPDPPVTADRAAAVLEDMYRQTLALVPDATNADGDSWEAAVPATTECDLDAMQTTVSTEFATSDNAATLAGILATWDAAGFDADRAILTDIRFDPVTGVALHITDRSTIDGLLHLSISTSCLSG